MRVVSLLPSATEILFALGFDREIVGVSHECDFPAKARTKPVVIHSWQAGALPEKIVAGWAPSLAAFEQVRRKYLLYK